MGTAPGRLLWSPGPELLERSAMARMRCELATSGASVGEGYAGLWRWSVEQLEAFWGEVFERFGIIHSAPYTTVLEDRTMPGAKWFPGVRLNYAEHLLAQGDGTSVAVIHADEARPATEVTWNELRAAVTAATGGLRALGVGVGDRVVSCLPNRFEALVAFLASASVGAIWASCSPDFGSESMIDRFAQIEPVVLFCDDTYRYGGKQFDRRAQVAELRANLPTLRHTILLDESSTAGFDESLRSWQHLLDLGADAEPEFVQLAFDAPLWILYSSGTTGLPKAIVHGHGGILLEHVKSHHLHLNLGPGDRFFWFSTTGWMMWNYVVSGLLTGGAVVLYDGNPGFPDLNVLWDLVADTRVTCMGTSAAFIAACMKAGIRPAAGRDLSALRAIGSTGSPLSPEAFDWVYDELDTEICLFSTSGGTDVCAAFMGGIPLLPVHRGELQGPALGVALDSFDDEGRPLVGEVGELVITEPMPSMPLYFWGDTDGERYRSSYFDMYPGVWRHGDWVEITARGTEIIFGRSDSTINRGGIRMGTSEIYRAVLAEDAVLDALVVDVPREGTQGWMSLFVTLRPGAVLDRALSDRVRSAIRTVCTPRHVPDEILVVPEIPRTLSGKTLEVPVKRILMGMSPGRAASPGAMANPAALEPFIALAEARRGLEPRQGLEPSSVRNTP